MVTQNSTYNDICIIILKYNPSFYLHEIVFKMILRISRDARYFLFHLLISKYVIATKLEIYLRIKRRENSWKKFMTMQQQRRRRSDKSSSNIIVFDFLYWSYNALKRRDILSTTYLKLKAKNNINWERNID